jgi:hypothetical protein
MWKTGQMQSGTAVNLIEWDNIKCGITEGEEVER